MTSDELRLEDYKCAWELFLENVRAVERNETYAIGAVAVVMSFSIASKDPVFAVGSSVLTLLIAYIGRIRYVGLGIIAREINNYLLLVEQRMGVEGWQTFRRSTEVGNRLRKGRLFLWNALFCALAAFIVLVVVIHWPMIARMRASLPG